MQMQRSRDEIARARAEMADAHDLLDELAGNRDQRRHGDLLVDIDDLGGNRRTETAADRRRLARQTT